MGANPQIDFGKGIVLYDGVCNFCNSSVNFIIRNEKSDVLKFAALQSDLGLQILESFRLNTSDFDSIVYVDDNGVLEKSRAAFRIASFLKPPLSALSVFRFLPSFLTNFIYDLVAKNRYKIFGKSDQCMLPSPEIRGRFLDVSAA